MQDFTSKKQRQEAFNSRDKLLADLRSPQISTILRNSKLKNKSMARSSLQPIQSSYVIEKPVDSSKIKKVKASICLRDVSNSLIIRKNQNVFGSPNKSEKKENIEKSK